MKREMIMCMVLLCGGASAVTYQVTMAHDELPDGCQPQDCTLREAIIAANQNPGEDTVLLDDVTYFIYQQAMVDDDLGFSGDLDVLDDLRLVGQFTATEPLAVQTAIDAGQLDDTVFEVHEGVSFYMEQVVVKESGHSGASGGVIKASEASIHLNQVVLSQNKARRGGVIYSLLSDINIQDSVFDDNEAVTHGGAIMLVGGSLQLTRSYLIRNQALGSGGGIHASYLAQQNQPAIELDNVFLIENYAEALGGGMYVSGTENVAAKLLINRSVLQNNEALYGGALRQDGSIKTHINASLLFANQAAAHGTGNTANGGAVMQTTGNTPFKPELLVTHSAMVDNFAENEAGAIYSSLGQVDLLNVTLSQNQAENFSTLASNGSVVGFSHVTAYGNNAFNGVDFLLDDDSHLTLVNSLLVGRCSIDSRNAHSLGGNIESPANGCGLGAGMNDQSNVSPTFLLDITLAFNGGHTPSHAISSTSLAVDNGVPLVTTSTDQRYMPRDSAPDTGAFEMQAFEHELIFKNGAEY